MSSTHERQLAEAFRGMGLSAEVADRAAAGRNPRRSGFDGFTATFEALGASPAVARRAAQGREPTEEAARRSFDAATRTTQADDRFRRTQERADWLSAALREAPNHVVREVAEREQRRNRISARTGSARRSGVKRSRGYLTGAEIVSGT